MRFEHPLSLIVVKCMLIGTRIKWSSYTLGRGSWEGIKVSKFHDQVNSTGLDCAAWQGFLPSSLSDSSTKESCDTELEGTVWCVLSVQKKSIFTVSSHVTSCCPPALPPPPLLLTSLGHAAT